MGSHNGFVYELNAVNFLKNFGIVPSFFSVSGNDASPDLIIQKSRKTALCELKIKNASAGSLVLKYDCGWYMCGGPDHPLIHISKEYNLFEILSEHWSACPLRFTQYYFENRQDSYKQDKERFKEVKLNIDSKSVGLYYSVKGVDYINIGNAGLYHFGHDRLKLNVKDFSECADVFFRSRVQYKKNYSYQFTFELGFKVKEKSNYNLAPIKSLKDVSIKNTDLSWYYT